MKAQIIRKSSYFNILKNVLSAGLLSLGIGVCATSNAEVMHRLQSDPHAIDGQPGSMSGESPVSPQLVYVDQSSGPAIYSYPSNKPVEASVSPQLIYVSLAYGPAIYSYPHSGTDTISAWNVEYIDTAYGPAIYSYGGHRYKGGVEILPLQPN